jgi:cytochrome b561
MTDTTAPAGYSATQIALHWAVAALVAGQYLFHDAISGAWEAIRAGETVAFDPLILAHVAGGGLILAFVVWRLALRLGRGAPAAPAQEPAPLATLAHVAHWAFYALLIGMALSGALAWFADVAPAARAHNVLKIALLALVALHVAAIPVHKLALKSDVMRRMIHPAD